MKTPSGAHKKGPHPQQALSSPIALCKECLPIMTTGRPEKVGRLNK
ncbi:hypothetical protein HM1_1896 [Heliomicrobium modesticaldum Ice1]|uniref:Uncharacterized protein n=1 Tax=Heliobacterium modesticaldum (strain ATCC 51547 / Ice1) TaxID=498761 RepID=B0TFD7_HELMI|nr:hypothetical protein HM1_1896 [Heliomicrobium modesticaldum Ice1]